MKKMATLLLVLLMIGGLFAVSVTAIESTPAEGLTKMEIEPADDGAIKVVGPPAEITALDLPMGDMVETEEDIPRGLEDTAEKNVVPPGVVTSLPVEPIKHPPGGIEIPIGLEDPANLRTLKSKPFVQPSKQIYSVEEDSPVEKGIEIPIGTEDPERVWTSKSQPLAPNHVSNFEVVSNADNPGLNDGNYYRPPDPILAVGPNHVIVMDNSLFAIYTKSGTLVQKTGLKNWFSNVYTGGEYPFDPHIAYDHHEGHWLMVAIILDFTNTESWYLLSVSQTSDPTGAWWNYKLDGKLNYCSEDTWADYPDLGFDGISSGSGGAVYITSNQFTFASPSFRTAMLSILPKSALYSGSGLSYWTVWDRTNNDGSQAFTLRAAHTFGNPGGEFLINTKSQGWDNVTLWRVNPTYPPTPVDWTRQATISIGSYSPPPNAKQMGCSDTLDTIDNRIYNAMYRNGKLYAAFTQAYDWGSGTVAAIRYLKIDTSTNNWDINTVYGLDGYDYWFPAIYTDSSNNIVFVFACSSLLEYAGIRYTGRKTTDSSTQGSAQLKGGEKCISGDPARWGDFFGIGNDPANGGRVWIYGEWAKDASGIPSSYDWGTWVGQVTFATVDYIDDIAMFQNGWWALKYGPVNLIPDFQGADKWLAYGTGGWTPVAGDFNNDGTGDIAIFQNGWWALKYGPVNAIADCQPADKWLAYGTAGWTPVVGDFNNDGIDDIAIFQDGWWALKYGPVNAIPDFQGADKWLAYGTAGWTPVVGDYNNDDIDDIAIFQDGWWALKYGPVNAIADCQPADKWLAYGVAGWTPIVGDYNNDDIEDIAIFQNGWWALKYGPVNAIADCQPADKWLAYGAAGWTPVVGDFSDS